MEQDISQRTLEQIVTALTETDDILETVQESNNTLLYQIICLKRTLVRLGQSFNKPEQTEQPPET